MAKTKGKIDPTAALQAAAASAEAGRAEVRTRAGVRATQAAIDDLIPNPANPERRTTGGLDELAASIKEIGILQPLVVRERRDDDVGEGRWVIRGGHRRWAAAQRAGLTTVPVHVVDSGDDLQVMLVENLQRSDVTPMEEARTLQLLIDQGHTQAQIAKMVSISQGQVSKRLALLKLDAKVQDAIERDRLTVDAVQTVMAADKERAGEVLAQAAVQAVPPTEQELLRMVSCSQEEDKRRQRAETRRNELLERGATQVASDWTDDAAIPVSRYDNQAIEEALNSGHLHFAGPTDHQAFQFWTTNPETKRRRDERDAGAEGLRQRLAEAYGEATATLRHLVEALVDRVPENKPRAEGADLIAAHVVKTCVEGVIYDPDDPLNHMLAALGLEGDVDEIPDHTPAERWRIARLLVSAEHYFDDELADNWAADEKQAWRDAVDRHEQIIQERGRA